MQIYRKLKDEESIPENAVTYLGDKLVNVSKMVTANGLKEAPRRWGILVPIPMNPDPDAAAKAAAVAHGTPEAIWPRLSDRDQAAWRRSAQAAILAGLPQLVSELDLKTKAIAEKNQTINFLNQSNGELVTESAALKREYENQRRELKEENSRIDDFNSRNWSGIIAENEALKADIKAANEHSLKEAQRFIDLETKLHQEIVAREALNKQVKELESDNDVRSEENSEIVAMNNAGCMANAELNRRVAELESRIVELGRDSEVLAVAEFKAQNEVLQNQIKAIDTNLVWATKQIAAANSRIAELTAPKSPELVAFDRDRFLKEGADGVVYRSGETPAEVIICATLPDGWRVISRTACNAAFRHNDDGVESEDLAFNNDLLMPAPVKRMKTLTIFINPKSDDDNDHESSIAFEVASPSMMANYSDWHKLEIQIPAE